MKYICITISLLLFCCSKPKEDLSTSERLKIEKEVTAMLQQYCDDIRQGGFMAELQYLDNSEAFYWVPPGYATPIGYDSIVTIITHNAPAYRYVDNQWEDLKVTVLTPDLALYTGRLQSHMTDTSGAIAHARLMETGLVIKRVQAWKLYAGHTSPIR